MIFEITNQKEQRRRRQTVTEHLQQNAIQRGVLLDVVAGSGDRENSEQAIAEVADGRISEDALEIALREGGQRAEDDGGDRHDEQEIERGANLRGKNRQEQAKKSVNAHLRHQSS